MTKLARPVSSQEVPLRIVAGSITLGSTAVASYTGSKGVTVARTAAGLYTITLNDSYKGFVSASVIVQSTSAADLNAQVVSYSAGVLTIRTIAVATETDGASGSIIYYTILLSKAL